MLAFAAIAIALASMVLNFVLAARIARLEAIDQKPTPIDPPALDALPARPLQGLRISIEITQDHPHAIFADLLKEILLTEDAEVKTGDAEIVIAGQILCNGYSDIYYQADLTCSDAAGPICTLISKPPHGDRQSNLALELVTKLKTEKEKLATRHERKTAIRELHGGA